ncbi:efflux RND transporter periplasmic adaptor subunit [Pirellulaceae bacterium SH501]
MNDSAQLDLKRLQRQTTSPSSQPKASQWRRVLTRWTLPAAIVLGFLGLMGFTAGQRLIPRHRVTIVPVMVGGAQSSRAGTPLFQAAGWVEPRPQAVSVASLAAGVIDGVMVVEGQFVEQDEPIAKLVVQDAELLLRQSRANLSLREGELARCEAELKAATSRREHPVHLEVTLAEANGVLAKARTELARLPYLIEAARSMEVFAKANWEGKLSAQEGLVGRVVKQAENEYVTARTTLKELVERRPLLEKEIDALQQKVTSIQSQMNLMIDENRQVDEAKARLHSAKATVEDAMVQVEQAELNVNRMIIRSPMSGRILRLLVSRGTRVMGLETTAGQNTSTIATMYDPAMLQVRADVRLEDVPKLQPGQQVEVKTASTTEVIQGRLLQSTSSANIQKNTLEVKVELLNPPPSVCPEMLVSASFLASEAANDSSQPQLKSSILVPRSLVDSDESGSFVWIVASDLRATKQGITLSDNKSGELAEVTAGLTPTDKLIVQGRENVSPGARLKIVGQDQTLGVNERK